MIVRKFRKNDARKVCIMINKTQRGTLGKIYSKKLIEAFCKYNNSKHIAKRASEYNIFVAEMPDRKIVGVICQDGNRLKKFFVHPRYQGKGIGRQLFDRFEEQARREGHHLLIVNSSHYAVPIYKALGFKKKRVVTSEKQGIRYQDTVMEKNI